MKQFLVFVCCLQMLAGHFTEVDTDEGTVLHAFDTKIFLILHVTDRMCFSGPWGLA